MLRPMELTGLMAEAPNHHYPPTLRSHIDGSYGLWANGRNWAVVWLEKYRKAHPL